MKSLHFQMKYDYRVSVSVSFSSSQGRIIDSVVVEAAMADSVY
jgi:hypothetical protein